MERESVEPEIFIITAETFSDWKSCQSITANLLRSYLLAFPKKTVIGHLSRKENGYEAFKLAQTIMRSRVKNLVFVDHQIFPHQILYWLKQLDSNFNHYVVHLHVFGDFPLFAGQWLKAEACLKELEVKLICASDKQVKLIKKFLLDSDNSVFKIPFPVDPEHYYFEKEKRSKARQKAEIKENETVFLYSGRISLLKNVVELVQIFEIFSMSVQHETRLLIAGELDSVGIPYLGLKEPKEILHSKLEQVVLMAKDKGVKVEILGPLSQAHLREFYSLSDVFCSLSVYHDEDYGMSPAEAMMMGLPCLLTDWGGYSSFDLGNNGVSLIKTSLGETKAQFRKTEALNAFINFHNNIGDFRERRQDYCRINYNHFSISAVAEKLIELKNIPDPKFSGFATSLENLAKIGRSQKPLFGEISFKSEYTENYRELYKSYVSEKL